MLNIFGRDKDQLYDILVCFIPLPPDLVKLKLCAGRIRYYYSQKIMKSQTEKEKFFDSESSHGELFSKSDKSLSPAAGPCSSYRKEAPLREQIRQLKQELAFKEK